MWTRENDLMTLKECVTNNKAYLNDIRLKNHVILITKYEHVPTYDVNLLNANGTKCIDWFNNLYPFDCFNMVEELIYNYK